MQLTIEEAIQALRSGKMIIIVDDEQRENEGDLVCAAETITPEQVNFMIAHARGYVCVAINRERSDQLNLPPMIEHNTALQHTNFTVTVDAVKNTSTGISVHDRAITIQELANPNAKPEDFARPGHINPLLARDGGVLERPGHTEAVVDLMTLAGMQPVGVLCEILNEDGSMARMDSLERFSETHGCGIVTIEELIAYRQKIDEEFKVIA